jgi:hypothetical protein
VDWTEIDARLQRARTAFMRRDRHLLTANANERSMTHKFAEHLQNQFRIWSVDCEYNRDGDVPKQLRGRFGAVPPDDENAHTVFPDIIVHRRGRQLGGERRNLVVIEAKKSGNNDGGKDRAKLQAFRDEYGYAFTVLLLFVTGGNPDIRFERCSDE